MRLFACVLVTMGLIAFAGCKTSNPPGTKPLHTMATKPAEKAETIEPKKDATYTSGLWQYEYKVSNPGTRSEGYHGKLTHDGLPVPEPAGINSYYVTPWGKLYWVGRPTILYGGHGWMPTPKVSAPAGKEIPTPVPAKPGEPVVMMMVLADAQSASLRDLTLEKWINDELAAMKAPDARVDRDWARLTEQGIELTATKLYGVLGVNLAPPAADTITINIAGSKPQKVQLPNKAGATKLIKHTLNDHLGNELIHYLAFKVERAATK